jgi:hypothetical protein
MFITLIRRRIENVINDRQDNLICCQFNWHQYAPNHGYTGGRNGLHGVGMPDTDIKDSR